MILILDIGNTNITIGLCDDNKIVRTEKLETDISLTENEYGQVFSKYTNVNINGCIVASVVQEIDEIIKKAIQQTFNISPIFVNSNINLGFKIKSEHPETAGADRIANAAYASKLCPKPSIVVDIGSAVTFDVIDKNGDFIGGLIMPGLGLQLKTLYENTSKLPQIEIKPVEKTINNDTENSILSGVVRGTACAIDGLILECQKELGEKPYVALTGGNSELISKYLARYEEINPNLTLEGINLIYKLNH